MTNVTIEGIGEIDARLQTVGLWVNKDIKSHKGGEERPYHRGVVYYLRGDKVSVLHTIYITCFVLYINNSNVHRCDVMFNSTFCFFIAAGFSIE